MSKVLQNKKSSFVPIYFVFFLDNFGFSLVFTIFGPLLLNPAFGFLSPGVSESVRNVLIGVLFAIFPLGQLFGSPIIGDMADHYGRRRTFFITLIGTVVGYILSALSILIHSYVLLLISRLLCGFVAGNLSLCLASIADLTPTERSRGRHYGFIAMTAGLSWILAMLAGGYLSDEKIYHYFNPAVPFLLAAVLSFLALWAVAALFKETRPSRLKRLKFDLFRGAHNVMTSFRIREVRWLYLVYFCWVIGWGATIQWFTPFSIERFHIHDVEISWALVGFGASWSIGGSLFNWFLLKELSSSAIAKGGLFLSFAFTLALAVCYYYTAFMWLYIISAAFAGVAMSNILNLISLSAPTNMQGKVMGLSQSTMALGWIIGPILGGLFAGYVSISWIYYFAAIFLFLSFLFLMLDNHKKRRAGRRSKDPFEMN